MHCTYRMIAINKATWASYPSTCCLGGIPARLACRIANITGISVEIDEQGMACLVNKIVIECGVDDTQGTRRLYI